MFLVVGSLLSNQNAGMSETQQGYLFHTNTVIPHKTSQQAHTRLVTTLGLPSLLYKHGLCLIHVTSLLHFIHFNKHGLHRYFTKPPSFTRHLRNTSVNTTDSRDYSLNSPGKNHLKTTLIRLYTLQHKILEHSGSTK